MNDRMSFKKMKSYNFEDKFGDHFLKVTKAAMIYWQLVDSAISAYGRQMDFNYFESLFWEKSIKKFPELLSIPWKHKCHIYDVAEYSYWRHYYHGVGSVNMNKYKLVSYILYPHMSVSLIDGSYVIRDSEGNNPFPWADSIHLIPTKKTYALKPGEVYEASRMVLAHRSYTPVRSHKKKPDILEVADWDPDDLVLYFKFV